MAVQPAIRMWSRAGSNTDLSDNFRRINVAFTEAYQILHDPSTNELDVYAAPNLPGPGTAYPGTTFVVANRARLQRVSPIMTIATVDYVGEVAIGQNGQPTDNPLLAPPTIDWDTVLSEEDIDEDADGNPITNTAGDFVEGIKMAIPDFILTVNRNFANWDTYAQAIYSMSTNSDTFAGWAPGTGKIEKLKATSVIGDPAIGFGYWRATLQVRFRFPFRTTADKSWYARYLNQGFNELFPYEENNQTKYLKVRCVDDNKQPVSRPVRLDIDGKRILDDDAPSHWNERRLYNPLPYSMLGFL